VNIEVNNRRLLKLLGFTPAVEVGGKPFVSLPLRLWLSVLRRRLAMILPFWRCALTIDFFVWPWRFGLFHVTHDWGHQVGADVGPLVLSVKYNFARDETRA
jgi:hypothetical protein